MDLFTELKKYKQVFENELHHDILSYWIANAVDEDGGTCIGNNRKCEAEDHGIIGYLFPD